MHNYFMKKAIDEALEGIHSGHGGPFGAVVVKDGKVIGIGHNRVISDHDPTMHGEVSAIRDACKKIGSHDLTGCVIYTTAQPCPMCLCAIFWAGISEIYYGCRASDTSEIGFRDEEFYNLIRSSKKYGTETFREECLKVFKEYESLLNKKKY